TFPSPLVSRLDSSLAVTSTRANHPMGIGSSGSGRLMNVPKPSSTVYRRIVRRTALAVFVVGSSHRPWVQGDGLGEGVATATGTGVGVGAGAGAGVGTTIGVGDVPPPHDAKTRVATRMAADDGDRNVDMGTPRRWLRKRLHAQAARAAKRQR